MRKYKRIIMIVTDSLGIGGDKRAQEFGDKGANTLHAVSKTGDLKIPTWKKLGIDSIAKLEGYNKPKNQIAYMARVNIASNAKDTLAGHWEMMGIKTTVPFPTFTKDGFPNELINELENKWNRKIVGNKASSGTTILDELAMKEIEDGNVIVYTSADPVLQICGHEKYSGLDNLYHWAKTARELCNSKPEWNVGRIIARSYVGEKPGEFVRTSNRHDYAVIPPEKTILNRLQDKGVNVVSIGKINDIFSGIGISEHHSSQGDEDGMDIAIDLMSKKTKDQFIFVNLVDFDAKFGHRRNAEGYADNLNKLDIKLAKLINSMNADDLFIMTSDHGNDPSFPGSDHTREHVPCTIFSKSFTGKPKALNDFQSLATVGNIVASNFDIELASIGEDRSNEII